MKGEQTLYVRKNIKRPKQNDDKETTKKPVINVSYN